MAKNILITGATGLVGRKLVPFLQEQGHQVSVLSRKHVQLKDVQVYIWDVYHQTIDPNALNGIDTIIHLAGEGIADKKWSAKRKKEIVDSRVSSAHLLYKTIRERKAGVTTFVSASAVGFYSDRGEEILTEHSASGSDFLADCCVKWENAADEGMSMGIRVVKIRIGLILSKADGALASIAKPIQLFVGSPLGSGKQWMPWIHLDDIVKIFSAAAIDTTFVGAYNASAPYPVTNTLFTKTLAKKLHRPVWPIKVPVFALKMILGEMSILPLMSSNTSVQKLLDTGYRFSHIDLDEALDSIYS